MGIVRECLSSHEQVHEAASRLRFGGQVLWFCVVIDLLQTDGCRNEGRLASKCKMQVPGTDTSFPSPGIPQAELCSSVVHHQRQDGRGSRPHLKATKSYQHWICCLILATEMWRERVFLFAWRQGIPFKLGQARTTSVSNKILFLFIFSAGPPTAFCQWHRDGGQCRLEPGPLPCFYLAAERLGPCTKQRYKTLGNAVMPRCGRLAMHLILQSHRV